MTESFKPFDVFENNIRPPADIRAPQKYSKIHLIPLKSECNFYTQNIRISVVIAPFGGRLKVSTTLALGLTEACAPIDKGS
jgi:hypothetical protein